MEGMTQEEKDEQQRQQIAEEKSALFNQLIGYIILSGIISIGFYYVTIMQNPHLSNDFEV